MTCLCGDIFCPSCGPAQGNYRCYNCGAWEVEGGCEDPEKCEAALASLGDRMLELEEEIAEAAERDRESKK